MDSPSSAKILVLVNPISGKGEGTRAASRLGEIFQRLGLEADVRLLSGPGRAADLIEKDGPSYSAVVAVGGDGTVNETARAAYSSHLDRPLGLIPLGLSNCLARHLNLPWDLEDAARVIAAGKTRPVDLAVVSGGVVTSFLGVGFDAEVVKRVAGARQGPVRDRDYVKAAVSAFISSGRSGLRVTVDGRPIEGRYYQVILSAIENYAHYFSMAGGRGLSAYLFRGGGRLGLLRTLSRLVPHLDLVRAADVVLPVNEALEVRSEGGSGYYQCDGEYGGVLPMAAEIRPGALRFYVP